MLTRIISRLNYANVMATLAVFLALGGGIALAAISGNGSVRFGAAKGLPFAEYETILTLPGVGKVQALCSKGTTIRFKNTSGGPLQASVLSGADGEFSGAALAKGESLEAIAVGFGANDSIDTLRFHVFKATNQGKPMAEITVSHRYAGAGCDRRVAAQALTSE